MNILNFSRDEIKKLVDARLCSPKALRDYDIAMKLKEEVPVTKISEETDTDIRTVYRIRDKYLR